MWSPQAESWRKIFGYVESGTFDGNLTCGARRWVFPEDDFKTITPRALAVLVELTAQGELSWVVFLPAGYRL